MLNMKHWVGLTGAITRNCWPLRIYSADRTETEYWEKESMQVTLDSKNQVTDNPGVIHMRTTQEMPRCCELTSCA